MIRRLPKGEETLPVIEVGGELLTPAGLERAHPELRLDELRAASTRLLIERKRIRANQGRVATIYRFRYRLTPEEQIRHMELQDAIGLEIIEAERKLLKEEVRILRGDYGRF